MLALEDLEHKELLLLQKRALGVLSCTTYTPVKAAEDLMACAELQRHVDGVLAFPTP